MVTNNNQLNLSCFDDSESRYFAFFLAEIKVLALWQELHAFFLRVTIVVILNE